MQKLKIRNAKSIEGQIHQYLKNSDEARFIHRLHGILLLLNSDENNCKTIADLFRNSPRSLSNWVHNINWTRDIDILRDSSHKGRTPRLGDRQLKHLKTILKEHPSKLGLCANILDGKTLSHYIKKEFSVTLQVRQCQRLYIKWGSVLSEQGQYRQRGTMRKRNRQKKPS